MKFACGVAVSLAIAAAMAPRAEAASISTSTKTYAISGSTGKELMRSMNRRGPKHSFWNRAMAQTQYTVKWDIKYEIKDGNCRVARANPVMDMVFVYPKPSGPLSPDLQRKWNAFLGALYKHEAQHGAYARQMLNEAERAVRSVRVAGDASCNRTKAIIGTRVSEIYDEYKAKQYVFDRREHRKTSQISRLEAALTK